MIDALCDNPSEKPGLYLDKMAVFLWDESHTISIRRGLVVKK